MIRLIHQPLRMVNLQLDIYIYMYIYVLHIYFYIYIYITNIYIYMFKYIYIYLYTHIFAAMKVSLNMRGIFSAKKSWNGFRKVGHLPPRVVGAPHKKTTRLWSLRDSRSGSQKHLTKESKEEPFFFNTPPKFNSFKVYP